MRPSSQADISTVPLARAFYERDTVRVARELLGTILVRTNGHTVLRGVIVEAEAYRGEGDPASHAYRGPTKRNAVMFGPAGHAYVYFTYGMHYCLNVTTEPTGNPGAVLIRAAQPTSGIEQMKKRRRTDQLRDLANGPAKLTQAFAVSRSLNGHDLTLGKKLFIVKGDSVEPLDIASTSRIGIRVGLEKPWRFFIRENPFVSKQ